MAKGKSSTTPASWGAFNKQTKSKEQMKAFSLVLKRSPHSTILSVKTEQTKKASEAQKEQREVWCSCDSMYRRMSTGQEYLWEQYYYDEKQKGRTSRVQRIKTTGKSSSEIARDIGIHGLFMEGCLTRNLKVFLEDYLLMRWKIISTEYGCETTKVTVQAVSEADYDFSNPLREFKSERDIWSRGT